MMDIGRAMIVDAAARSGLTALPSQTKLRRYRGADADAAAAAMRTRGFIIRPAYREWTQYSRVSTGKLKDAARYAAALPEVIGGLWAA